MGRRFADRGQGGASHAVLVVHPSRAETRPCELSFARRGVVLDAPGGTTVLQIPWWALAGLSADDTAAGPDGRLLQAVRMVTDAGVLTMLLAAPSVTALLASLNRWRLRWRVARHPFGHLVARQVAAAGALARPAATAARRRGSRLVGALPAPVQLVAHRAARRPRALAAVLSVGVLTLAAWGGVALTTAPAPLAAPPASAEPLAHVGAAFDASGMAQIIQAAEFQAGAAARLVRATAPPPPAPASVADAAPLSSHEVLGFAPYWSLDEEATFDVSGFTTLAYFAVGVNANGTLDESGTGWDGYESQDFADLVARAHGAGDRVVLTVNCFSQAALNALTSSPTAAATLASAVVHAVSAKNLDGVNIDFEGQGSGDQAGLTALVATVSSAMHAANPHYQVTVDTYASSAADPGGFYNVPALAKVVDGLFVMAYETNLGASGSAASPITSAEYSDTTAAAQYAAVVPPSKVIFGVPYFGYVWPTTNGTMSATAMGTGTPIAYSQVVADGDPLYWDPVTDTAWTSYEIGTQWYEAYVDDPASVYMVAQLAQREGFAGVGAWALGMDGNSPQMTAALDGNAPPERAGPAGPASTSSSAGAGSASASSPTQAGRGGAAGSTGPSTTTTTVPTLTQPTDQSSGSGSELTYRYSAVWQGQTVSLTLEPTAVPSGAATLVGTLAGFSTTNPALACLAQTPSGVDVWRYPGAVTDLVIARAPTNCATAEFVFGSSSTGATGNSGVTAGAIGATSSAGATSSTTSSTGASPGATSSTPGTTGGPQG